MRTLAIIPARGGSKGVPGKNIRSLAGQPLLRYTADAANHARTLDRVILSTDSEEIATVGRSCGLDVPFMRPAELARDDTPSLPVFQHAVEIVESADDLFDAVCILQPTTPLRTPETIDACVTMLAQSAADSVMTVLPVPHQYNPHWVYVEGSDGCLHLSTGETEPVAQRQLLPSAFHREGSVYVVRRDVLMSSGSLYGQQTLGFEIDPASSVNIDNLDDWHRAEEMINKLQRAV